MTVRNPHLLFMEGVEISTESTGIAVECAVGSSLDKLAEMAMGSPFARLPGETDVEFRARVRSSMGLDRLVGTDVKEKIVAVSLFDVIDQVKELADVVFSIAVNTAGMRPYLADRATDVRKALDVFSPPKEKSATLGSEPTKKTTARGSDAAPFLAGLDAIDASRTGKGEASPHASVPRRCRLASGRRLRL